MFDVAKGADLVYVVANLSLIEMKPLADRTGGCEQEAVEDNTKVRNREESELRFGLLP